MPRELPEPLDVVGDRLRRARIREVDGDARGAQALELHRREVRPGHDQIGLERENAFEVDRVGVAHPGQRARLGRPIRGREHADDFPGGAGSEQQLGGMRGQAHDAPRRDGQRHLRAAGVGHHDRALRARRDQPQQQQCERLPHRQ